MNILAVECCLKLTGAALMVDGKIYGHDSQDFGRKQTSELPRICERLMNDAGLTWPELDYITLTNGPGYFTGIRVGAAYASGIAYASGAKVIPVSTLELLPYIFRKSHNAGKILTVIYAGHGFVYASCSGFLDAGEYSHGQILSWLNENPDAVIISDDPERTALDAEISQVRPDAISLCEIAGMNTNCAVDPEKLRITYFRAPQGAN
ncbi:MAG: tRNA (adenosine(37)-N6)-threonylcarbamoyltransferase complex dimerization subunit type 1 TsaB [Synergistaceae bacterium]|nr:tRNA (adenosine(37)-N6)-threonylcarbamoyltransferase complex dimerization subunit type 1 TsaB [Synergistaceae bacterium]